MNYIHSETMNCAENFEKVLLSISTFKATSIIMLASDVEQDGLMERKAFVVENCEYHEKTFPEVNAFKYVCGYLIKKCLQIHSREVCIKFANDDAELYHTNLFIYFKAYNKKFNTFGGLKTNLLQKYSKNFFPPIFTKRVVLCN
jgi:hypothetical protein